MRAALALLLTACSASIPAVPVASPQVEQVQQVQARETTLTQSLRPQVQHGVILSPIQKLEMERQANQLKVQ